MAAHRNGIFTAILSQDNEKDLRDILASVKKKLKTILVDNMDQVLNEALVDFAFQSPEKSQKQEKEGPFPESFSELPAPEVTTH